MFKSLLKHVGSIKQFLCEANGDYSMIRFSVLVANAMLMYATGVWGTVALQTGTVPEFPYNIAIIAIATNTTKSIQKFTETKPITVNDPLQ